MCVGGSLDLEILLNVVISTSLFSKFKNKSEIRFGTFDEKSDFFHKFDEIVLIIANNGANILHFANNSNRRMYLEKLKMLNNEALTAKIEFETTENGLPTGRKKRRTAACLKEPDGDTRALVATWILVSNLPQK